LGANVPVFVRDGAVYRVLTATVLHVGILHLLMNLSSLIVFCAMVEALFTPKIYLAVYLIGGIQGIPSPMQATCSSILSMWSETHTQ
jgi:rhomboid protease GluP